MKNYPTKKLHEVCERVKNIKPENKFEEDFMYIDISSVHAGKGIRDYKFYSTTGNIPSRARRPIKTGDTLFALTRPYLRNIAFVTKDYDDAVASTGFSVLRPNREVIDERYLFLYIQSDVFLNKILSFQTGATYPAVSESRVMEQEIPLPPLPEQKRIVKILDEKLGVVREAVAFREQALADTEKILSARLREIFEKGKEDGWKEKELSEISDYFIGLTYKPSDKTTEDGVIVLRSSNIQNDQLDFSDIVRVSTNIKDKLFVKNGDILMCTRNGSKRLVGKTARIVSLEESMTFGAFTTIVRGANNDFLYWFFKSKEFFNQFDHGGGPMINQITLKMLNNIKVPLPNLTTQQKFVAELDVLSARVAELRALQTEQLADLRQLEKAYLREAFNGAL